MQERKRDHDLLHDSPPNNVYINADVNIKH